MEDCDRSFEQFVLYLANNFWMPLIHNKIESNGRMSFFATKDKIAEAIALFLDKNHKAGNLADPTVLGARNDITDEQLSDLLSRTSQTIAIESYALCMGGSPTLIKEIFNAKIGSEHSVVAAESSVMQRSLHARLLQPKETSRVL